MEPLREPSKLASIAGLPRLDGTSWVSILVVAVALAVLPPRAALALLGSEVLFAASAALRLRRHAIFPSLRASPRGDSQAELRTFERTRPTHQRLDSVPSAVSSGSVAAPGSEGVEAFAASSAPPQRPEVAQLTQPTPHASSLPGPQTLAELFPTGPVGAPGAADSAAQATSAPGPGLDGLAPDPDGGATAAAAVGSSPRGASGGRWMRPHVAAARQPRATLQDSLQMLGLSRDYLDMDRAARAELLARKLLDPQEGHVSLLRGGHLLAQWFSGLEGHQLRPDLVARLLAYLTTPPPPPPRAGRQAAPTPVSLPLPLPLQLPLPLPLPLLPPLTDALQLEAAQPANHAGPGAEAAPEAQAAAQGPSGSGLAAAAELEALALRLVATLELPCVPPHAAGASDTGGEGGAAVASLAGSFVESGGGAGAATAAWLRQLQVAEEEAQAAAEAQVGAAMAEAAEAAVEMAMAAAEIQDLEASAAATCSGADAGGAEGSAPSPGTVHVVPQTITAATGAQSRLLPPQLRPLAWLGRRLHAVRAAQRSAATAPTASASAPPPPPSTTATPISSLSQQPRGRPAAAHEPRLFAAAADPLSASYRPLAFYLLTEAIAGASHVALTAMGFTPAPTPAGAATVYVWTPPSQRRPPVPPRRWGSAARAPAAPVQAEGMGAAGATRQDAVGSIDAAAAGDAPETKGEEAGECVPEAGEGQVEGAVQEPLLFLHGIGLGLAPYLRLLGRTVAAAGGGRAVYAVQYKHVSMRLCAHIPAPHEVAADVAAFLAQRGVRSVSVLAHSYGTLVAAGMIKVAAASPQAPQVARLTLVDPVCFAMFLPHLVRNALYLQPVDPRPMGPPGAQAGPALQHTAEAQAQAAQAAEAAAAAEREAVAAVAASAEASLRPATEGAPAAGLGSVDDAGRPPGPAAVLRRAFFRYLLRGLVTAEFHCSVALRHRMDWPRVNLWPSELPPLCCVVLSGRDNLVPAEDVRAILANRAALLPPDAPRPRVLFHPHHGHGGFLGDTAAQAQVLAAALGLTPEQVEERLAAAAKAKADEAGAAARPARRWGRGGSTGGAAKAQQPTAADAAVPATQQRQQQQPRAPLRLPPALHLLRWLRARGSRAAIPITDHSAAGRAADSATARAAASGLASEQDDADAQRSDGAWAAAPSSADAMAKGSGCDAERGPCGPGPTSGGRGNGSQATQTPASAPRAAPPATPAYPSRGYQSAGTSPLLPARTGGVRRRLLLDNTGGLSALDASVHSPAPGQAPSSSAPPGPVSPAGRPLTAVTVASRPLLGRGRGRAAAPASPAWGAALVARGVAAQAGCVQAVSRAAGSPPAKSPRKAVVVAAAGAGARRSWGMRLRGLGL
ncbi:hypothetical protein HYH03_006604 [Edaphochlamys debaryana]|uniref:AB hydrolase-1 domain-containing protein n=1 Tax=Edaphochlamys debaryana TaxID=47281 RepID=A0A835YD53_9CHLO|nr:hypothetical protein HYH03_006604 [Edaphochlamys debaryana]|eukprot:KAG2495334.1 hypothetical protein HYH03_006604 [Edaphochlamys debaryana]